MIAIKSACSVYVNWLNDLTGNWATWEPGAAVAVGDVGRFNEDFRFLHDQNLGDFNVRFSCSEERRVGSRLYVTGGDFHVGGLASAGLVSSIPRAGQLDSSVRITAVKQHACILQLQDPSESSVLDVRNVLVQIADLVQTRRWEIDLVAVMGRLRVRRGFAAISQGAGQSMEFGVAGEVPLADILHAGHAELHLAHNRGSSGFLLYEFSNRQTPVFLPPIRIKRSIWGRLLPWRREGSLLIAPDGRRFDPRHSRPAWLATLHSPDCTILTIRRSPRLNCPTSPSRTCSRKLLPLLIRLHL